MPATCRLGGSPECVCLARQTWGDKEDDGNGCQGYWAAGGNSWDGGQRQTEGQIGNVEICSKKKTKNALISSWTLVNLPQTISWPTHCAFWPCSFHLERRSLCRPSSWAVWDQIQARKLCASMVTLMFSQLTSKMAGIQSLSHWWRKTVRAEHLIFVSFWSLKTFKHSSFTGLCYLGV